MFKDPALSLISANNMKSFVPDEEFADSDLYKQTIDAAKKCFVDAIKASDKTKFIPYEKNLINELTNIIDQSSGLDFGEKYQTKLQELLSSLRSRADMQRVALRQKTLTKIKI